MCFGCMSGPPYGYPIPPEFQELYDPIVNAAWELLDQWVKETIDLEGNATILRSQIPIEIQDAMKLINETPIPGYDDDEITGAMSCYMVVLEMHIIDDHI